MMGGKLSRDGEQAGLTNDNGIAMFLVLWVLVLLSVIVGEYCYTMRMELNITRNVKESTEAYYIAEAGFNQAVFEIIVRETLRRQGRSPSGDTEEDADETFPEWRMNADIPRMPFGGGFFKVRFSNESGRINLNHAEESLLKTLLDAFDLEDLDKLIIVDSILDWRDEDSFHRLHGAENDYYRSLPDPYDCKDGPFDSVEELLLVRGVTPELFHEQGLKHLLTVVYDENIAAAAAPQPSFDFKKIDINAASEDVLMALPMMDMDIVEDIRVFREEDDFEDMGRVAEVIGPDVFPEAAPFITIDSSAFFTIESTGISEGGTIRHTINALIRIDFERDKKYSIIRWRDAAEASPELERDLHREMSGGVS